MSPTTIELVGAGLFAVAILRGHFDDEAVHPLGLLAAALPPTIVAALALHGF